MNPFRLISVAASRISKVGRAQGDSVITTAQGDDDRDYDSEFWGTHGIVSRPAKTTRCLRFRLGSLSIVIAAYTYGVDPPANPGACKLYSTDADGAEKVAVVLDSDGKIYAANNEANFFTLYFDLLNVLDNFDTVGNSVAQVRGPATKAAIAANRANAQKLLKESL